MRFIFALCLSFHLAIAGGTPTNIQNQKCEQGCTDDDEDGRCAPDCLDCVCCVHLSVSMAIGAVSQRVEPLIATANQINTPYVISVLSTPDPNKILQVPKLTLA